MATQTTMNGRHTADDEHEHEAIGAQVRQLRTGASRLVHDLVSLSELQTQLFVVDAKQGAQRTLKPVVFFAAAGAIALGLIPVVFAGIAGLLVLAGLHIVAAVWISIAIGGLAAGTLVWLARKQLRTSPKMFERSLTELSLNMTWLKNNIRPHADDE